MCLAVPGELYLMFLRWGGAVKLDLSAYEGSTYTQQWIDLVTEKRHASRELQGGRVHTINAPEDFPGVRQDKDWLLLVKAVEPSANQRPVPNRNNQRREREVKWVNPDTKPMPGLLHLGKQTERNDKDGY